jgi:LuxR family quorum sensing-dependent transcriptional regulator
VALISDEYGSRTLAFIEKLQQLTNYEEIRDLVVSELAWYGFTSVSSWSIPGPGEGPEGKVVLNTRPPDYIDHYVARRYIDRDPLITELRRSLSPFAWSDLQQRRRLSKAELRIIEEGREFDAYNGFIMPVVARTGSIAIFSPCGRDPNLSPRARSALEILGTYAHCALQRAVAQEQRMSGDRGTALTAREREIMRWVAAGKTDDEIGEILTIARETVTTHVENAKIKLNATRRTFAVVQALRFGEITL